MRLDDLARRAADDVRTRADDGTALGFDEWRRRRGARTAISLVGAGLAVVFAISLGAAIGEDDPDLAIDTSLPPEVVTTTTVPRTTTTAADEPPAPIGILGGGWERLDYGPLTGGRYRMATAWTGDHLFLFGGHLLESQEPPPATEFAQDGYLYDPATGTWTPTGRPPGLCQMGLTRAIPFGTGVLVHGSISIGGGFTCARAAFYDIDAGTWTTFDNELFADVSSLSPLADTGEMLVAPGAGLAWNYLTDEVTEIPRLPSDAAGSPPGPAKAQWTGTEVIVVGAGPTYAWAPGEEAWRQVDGPPIPVIARDSVMTDAGLLAVNYQMATAFYGGGEWARPGDLPLRFYECGPEAVSAGGTPAVRMCSGITLWDEISDHWVPIPLSDLTGADWGTLVGTDDALYAVGRSLRRFEIVRAGDGSIELPPTIPIGVMQLDVPDGWDQLGSIAPDQGPEGFIPDDETIGLGFGRADGTVCVVTSTYGHVGRLDPLTAIQPIEIHRPGRTHLTGIAYRQDDPFAIVYAFVDANESDTVLIECSGPNEGILSDAATEFAVGLWSPWETEPAELEEASLIVTPQAGPSGTVVTLRARDFPSEWSEWWLIDEDGNAVAEVPSGFPHDNPDFETAIVIDSIVEIPPGTYRFAIDGRIVAGASFTKTGARYPLELEFQSHPFGGIYEVSIENVGDAPIYLSDWWIVDEIPNGIELLLPRSTLDPDGQFFIEAGETLWIHIDQVAGCESGELLEQARYSLTYCAEPPAASAEGDSLALRTVSGDLVERLFVGKPCDAGSDDPYCGYATFRDADNRITFSIPDDAGLPPEVGRWHIADLSLTPNLVDPREILSVGTYPLRQGGDTCAQVPENALEDLGSLDAFVSVQRRTGGVDTSRPRPDEFTYEWFDEQAGSGFWDCLDRPDRDEMYLRWGSFVEDSYQYYLIVALGQDAHQTIRAEQVLRILDSLEFDA